MPQLLLFSLLLLIFFLIILPLLRLFLAARNLKNQVRDAFGGAKKQQQQAQTEQQKSKKVYSRDMGEYVAFEEVKGESIEEPAEPAKETPHRDSRISDVDFEEIK